MLEAQFRATLVSRTLVRWARRLSPLSPIRAFTPVFDGLWRRGSEAPWPYNRAQWNGRPGRPLVAAGWISGAYLTSTGLRPLEPVFCNAIWALVPVLAAPV